MHIVCWKYYQLSYVIRLSEYWDVVKMKFPQVKKNVN